MVGDHPFKADDSSEVAAKARLMAVEPALIVHRIEALLTKTDAGVVAWDGSDDEVNKLLAAFYTALAFCGTDTRCEWIVAGRIALVYLRQMEDFRPGEPAACGQQLVFIGKVRAINVYTYLHTVVVPVDRTAVMIVGTQDKAALVTVVNGTIHVPGLNPAPNHYDDNDDEEGMMPECVDDDDQLEGEPVPNDPPEDPVTLERERAHRWQKLIKTISYEEEE